MRQSWPTEKKKEAEEEEETAAGSWQLAVASRQSNQFIFLGRTMPLERWTADAPMLTTVKATATATAPLLWLWWSRTPTWRLRGAALGLDRAMALVILIWLGLRFSLFSWWRYLANFATLVAAATATAATAAAAAALCGLPHKSCCVPGDLWPTAKLGAEPGLDILSVCSLPRCLWVDGDRITS